MTNQSSSFYMNSKYFVPLLLSSCLLFVTCDYRGGSSLRSWQLTHELSSIQSGVINIDDDLTYLYGQLPDRIRAAAVSVMAKKMRDVLYNTSRAIPKPMPIRLRIARE